MPVAQYQPTTSWEGQWWEDQPPTSDPIATRPHGWWQETESGLAEPDWTDPFQYLDPGWLRKAAMAGVVIPTTRALRNQVTRLARMNPRARKLLSYMHQRPEGYVIESAPRELLSPDPDTVVYGDFLPQLHEPVPQPDVFERVAPYLDAAEAGRGPAGSRLGGLIRIAEGLHPNQMPSTLTHELLHGYDWTRDPRSHRGWDWMTQRGAAREWLQRINPSMYKQFRDQGILGDEAYTRFLVDYVFGGRSPSGSLWPSQAPPVWLPKPSKDPFQTSEWWMP